MAKKKTIGLDSNSKKLIKFKKYLPEVQKTVQLTMFINLGRQFYTSFKMHFGDGYQNIQFDTGICHDIPIQDLNIPLTLYHFSIEFLLKALLNIKVGPLPKDDKNHDLEKLLDKVLELYKNTEFITQLSKLKNEQEYLLLIEELGKNAAEIRYGEVCIMAKQNHKKGHKNKKPHAELNEVLDSIYHILNDVVEKAKILKS